MNLKELSKPLSIDQIDFRIQSINKGGYATILAYKDARVDMQRLDDAVGPLNWKREHKNNNHNCVVSIYNKEIGEWVSKEDTGTESNTEAEKGLASDSFKRACFNWGIGRELYEYPVISVKLNDDEFEVNGDRVKQTYKLRLKEWRWFSDFDSHGKIILLAAKDGKGTMRYEWRDIESVKSLAESLLIMIAEEDYDSLGEAWHKMKPWQQSLLWTAKSKGGFFEQAQKDIIRKAEYNFLNPTKAQE